MSQSQAVGFLSTQIMLVIVQALKHTEAFAIEVKTRAENSDAPLETISGAHLVQDDSHRRPNNFLAVLFTRERYVQFFLHQKK